MLTHFVSKVYTKVEMKMNEIKNVKDNSPQNLTMV